MLAVGLALVATSALYLIVNFVRTPKAAPYPVYGLVGLAVIVLAELLLFLDVGWITIYFTPIAWTGYIMAVDAAVFSVRGRSMLRSEPQAFVWMAVLSIFLWLIFELYNQRLVNWTYVGLPRNEFLRYLGYGWSFATIWPAVLETTEFLLVTQFRHRGQPPAAEVTATVSGPLGLNHDVVPHRAPKAVWVWVLLGLTMVTVPVLVPRDWGQYLFGSVWIGFIFLIDPLNYRAARASLWYELAHGYPARLWALLLAGGLCGLFWEFWNYWASAKWLYIFPIFEDWRLFEMPLLGYLGFPAFAAEIFVLYFFTVSHLKLPRYEIA